MKKALFYMLIIVAVQTLCLLFWAIAGLLWAVLFEVSFTKTVLAPMLLAGLLSSQVVLIWLFVSKKWAVVGWGSIDKRTRPYAIAVAMAFVVAIFPFDAVMVLSFPDAPDPAIGQLLGGNSSPILLVLSVCVLGPIAEELVFRGAVLPALYRWRRNAWLAIMVSAALFGLIHLNIIQGIVAFYSGIVMGWLYYRTRSVVPGMVLHVTSNSLYMLLDNVIEEKDLPSLTFSDMTPYLLVIFGVGLLLLCCWQANRLFAKCEPLMPE